MPCSARGSRRPHSPITFEKSGEGFTGRNTIAGMSRETGHRECDVTSRSVQRVPESTPRDTANASASLFVVVHAPRIARIRSPHADLNHRTAVARSLRQRVRQIGARFLHDAITCGCVDRNPPASRAAAIHRSKNGLATGGTPGVIKLHTTRACTTPRARAGSTFQSRETKLSSDTRTVVRGLGLAGAADPMPPLKPDPCSDHGRMRYERGAFFPHLLRIAAQDQGGPR
jgi:hypothetical protein